MRRAVGRADRAARECHAVLGGEVDCANADDIARFVARHRAPGVTIVVDTSRVTFMAVAGVNALVAARHACRALGGDLVVRNASTPVQRVLQLTDLEELARTELAPCAVVATRQGAVEITSGSKPSTRAALSRNTLAAVVSSMGSLRRSTVARECG